MATTQVLYDGKRIIPALRVEYSRSFNKTQNGDIIGQNYNISFVSKILPGKGSPNSSGVFWTLNDYPPDEVKQSSEKLSSILAKQQALRELFSKDNLGKKFEIIPEDNVSPIWFYPTSVEISFPEGTWFNDCDFTVSMVADRIYPDIDGSFNYNIESASESWSIEANEEALSLDSPFTYRVSHSLSAVGKKVYYSGVANQPFNEAKNWIVSRMGINNTVLSGVNNLSSMGGYNHIVGENIDIQNGSYSANESWIFSSGNVIEDFSISSQNGLDGITNVSIEGTIRGLELRTLSNVSGRKWDHASGYFNSIQSIIPARAQQYANLTLNPTPLSQNIGRNPYQGTINYSYEYNNRPTSFISGALSERIVVSYNNQNSKVAIVPVIGRPRGPVLQQLGTSEATTKSVSIDFNLGPSVGTTLESSDFNFPYGLISGIVDMLDPINNGASKSFKSQPQETWEPITGIASFNQEWVYE